MAVNFPPIKILYILSKKGVAGSVKAFNKLESKLATFKSRKFYGLIWGVPPNETYWACVALTDRDKPDLMGCNIGIIPGGKYVQKRIYDWENNLSSIEETFRELINTNNVDIKRPSIEFYHRMNYMVAMMPVRG